MSSPEIGGRHIRDILLTSRPVLDEKDVTQESRLSLATTGTRTPQKQASLVDPRQPRMTQRPRNALCTKGCGVQRMELLA